MFEHSTVRTLAAHLSRVGIAEPAGEIRSLIRRIVRKHEKQPNHERSVKLEATRLKVSYNQS